MVISLILAVTFVPLVLVLVFLGLVFSWLRMRRATRDDVVDLVALQKEPQEQVATEKYQGCKSSEPLPQLPALGLHEDGYLMAPNPRLEGKNFGNHTIESMTNMSRRPSNTSTTPPKHFSSLNESPSREALAVFDFDDSPSKPPIPARSIKRASGILRTPVTTPPTIKVETASPSNTSEASNRTQPLRLSPTIIGRAHARQTIEANAKTDETKPIPFSSVPITHINDPTSDSLPPTPARASAYLKQSLNQNQKYPYVPKDAEGMQAMVANREMMEIENWRPDLQKKLAAGKLDLKSKKSGQSMIGKRNSAIREYVKSFPEQNPWRMMIARRSRDVEAQQGEDEFMARFGGGRYE